MGVITKELARESFVKDMGLRPGEFERLGFSYEPCPCGCGWRVVANDRQEAANVNQ